MRDLQAKLDMRSGSIYAGLGCNENMIKLAIALGRAKSDDDQFVSHREQHPLERLDPLLNKF